MSDPIEKLRYFTSKLLITLEEEIEELSTSKPNVQLKKNMAEVLSKLTVLITNLRKLEKEISVIEQEDIIEEDIAIITEFIKKQ